MGVSPNTSIAQSDAAADWHIKRRHMLGFVSSLCALWHVNSLAQSSANQAGFPPRLLQLAQRLSQSPVVRANFIQRKQVAGLQRPLISKGQFLLCNRPLLEGVLWRIESPIQLTYWLTDSGITEIQANGQRAVRSANDMAAMAQVGKIFSGLLRLNQAELAKHFSTTYGEQGEAWQLQLLPNGQTANVIRQVRVQGKQFVELVEIEEANQDKLSIQLLDTQTAQALLPVEQQLIRGN